MANTFTCQHHLTSIIFCLFLLDFRFAIFENVPSLFKCHRGNGLAMKYLQNVLPKRCFLDIPGNTVECVALRFQGVRNPMGFRGKACLLSLQISSSLASMK